MKLGIIDIGSNSIHMILVSIGNNLQIEVLDRAKEFTQLGRNTFSTNKLSKEAIHRSVEVVNRFVKLAQLRGATKIKATATSAVRESENGGDFIDLIQENTGIKVRVITGKEEARLICLAARHAIQFQEKPYVIVDIGGGSIEIIVANNSQIFLAESYKLGVLRVRDEFITEDPPSKKDLKKLEAHLDETLNDVIKKINKLSPLGIVGTSGTIQNLVQMAQFKKSGQPITQINNFKIDTKEILDLNDELSTMNEKDRSKLKGLDPHRNDIIFSGSAVFSYLIKRTDLKEVIISDEALREGLVYDYLETHKQKIQIENQFTDLKQKSVVQLAQKCQIKEGHARQVVALSLALFDQTKKIHNLDDSYRELMAHSAFLHDCGYFIHYKSHHKHTYYMIKNGNLNGFDEREIEIMANIGRYHSRSLPGKKHENWQLLSRKDQKAVAIASAIVRIADALDRSHFSIVKKITVKNSPTKIRIHIQPESDPELEIWAANKRKDLLEKVLKKEVEIVNDLAKKKGRLHE